MINQNRHYHQKTGEKVKMRANLSERTKKKDEKLRGSESVKTNIIIYKNNCEEVKVSK